MKTGLLIVNEYIRSSKERFNALYLDLEHAFKGRDIKLDRMSNGDALILINEKIKPHYDFILFWDKDINLAHHLENLGYRLFNNARAIEIADDKAKTALALENKGIIMPKTIIAPFTFSNNPFTKADLGFVDSVVKELGLPLIVKEVHGSFGEQVYLAKSKEEVNKLILTKTPTQLLFQEYIASSSGRDVRIEVVGKKALGAVIRKSQNGDFRSNVLQGGVMEKISPDESFYKMAIDVCKILDLDFAGVDIMFGKNNEPIFCEVNSNVHFRTFAKTTGIDLAKSLAIYIENVLNN